MPVTRQCRPSCLTRSRPIRRSTRASAMTPSPPAALLQSFRAARARNPRSQTLPVRLHETNPSAHHRALGGPSGADGAVIIDEAVQRPRCTASSSWANVSPLVTSTVRSQSSIQSRRAKQLHRPRHTSHGSHGMSLSGEKGAPATRRFAQRSPFGRFGVQLLSACCHGRLHR